MAALRTLLVVDSPQAAQALTERELRGADVDALSTHCGAVDFLAARGVACSDCSEFVEPAQAGLAIHSASADLDAMLAALDDTVGAAMTASAGLPRLALFHAAFKYGAQYNLAGLRCFESVLTSKFAAGNVGAVRFCHALPTSDDPVFSFLAAARRLANQHRVEFAATAVATLGRSRRLDPARVLGQLARLASRAPRRAFEKVRHGFHRRRTAGLANGSPLVLLIAPDERSFFENALSGSGMSLLYVGDDGLVQANRVSQDANAHVERMQGIASEWLQAHAGDRGRELDRLFVAQIARNARGWLLPLVHAHLYLQSRHVAAAAWDIPLATRPHLNLLVELFLRSGIPVLGRQHGASYGDQDLGRIHFDSDFDRCTHFFSYGFGSREFTAAYPTARPTCSFIPAGNPPLTQLRRTKPIDIVFPITHRVSLFYFARLPETALAKRQTRILEAMDARDDLRCVVKPPPDDSTHDARLRRLNRVRVVRVPWTDYLRRCRPRLVVFEVASTPLLEVLTLDVDIFVMLDPLFPFADSALEMLRKRVHVFETADALADAIGRYGRVPVPPLRDRSYYDTYVNRGSPARVLDVLRAGAAPEIQSATP